MHLVLDHAPVARTASVASGSTVVGYLDWQVDEVGISRGFVAIPSFGDTEFNTRVNECPPMYEETLLAETFSLLDHHSRGGAEPQMVSTRHITNVLWFSGMKRGTRLQSS